MTVKPGVENEGEKVTQTTDTSDSAETTYLHSGDLGLDQPPLDEHGNPVFTGPIDEELLGDREGLRRLHPSDRQSVEQTHEIVHGPNSGNVLARFLLKSREALWSTRPKRIATSVGVLTLATVTAAGAVFGVSGDSDVKAIPAPQNTPSMTTPNTLPSSEASPNTSSSPSATASAETSKTPEAPKTNDELVEQFFTLVKAGGFDSLTPAEQAAYAVVYAKDARDNYNYGLFPRGYNIVDPEYDISKPGGLKDSGEEVYGKTQVLLQLPFIITENHRPVEDKGVPLDKDAAMAIFKQALHPDAFLDSASKTTQKQVALGIDMINNPDDDPEKGITGTIFVPEDVKIISTTDAENFTTQSKQKMKSRVQTITYTDREGHKHTQRTRFVYQPIADLNAVEADSDTQEKNKQVYIPQIYSIDLIG